MKKTWAGFVLRAGFVPYWYRRFVIKQEDRSLLMNELLYTKTFLFPLFINVSQQKQFEQQDEAALQQHYCVPLIAAHL